MRDTPQRLAVIDDIGLLAWISAEHAERALHQGLIEPTSRTGILKLTPSAIAASKLRPLSPIEKRARYQGKRKR